MANTNILRSTLEKVPKSTKCCCKNDKTTLSGSIHLKFQKEFATGPPSLKHNFIFNGLTGFVLLMASGAGWVVVD